jgi:phage terminase small subunit
MIRPQQERRSLMPPSPALPVDFPPKERAFAQHFVLFGDGPRAAIASGYPELAAEGISERLLARKVVKEEIVRLKQLAEGNLKSLFPKEVQQTNQSNLKFEEAMKIFRKTANKSPAYK